MPLALPHTWQMPSHFNATTPTGSSDWKTFPLEGHMTNSCTFAQWWLSQYDYLYHHFKNNRPPCTLWHCLISSSLVFCYPIPLIMHTYLLCLMFIVFIVWFLSLEYKFNTAGIYIICLLKVKKIIGLKTISKTQQVLNKISICAIIINLPN